MAKRKKIEYDGIVLKGVTKKEYNMLKQIYRATPKPVVTLNFKDKRTMLAITIQSGIEDEGYKSMYR